MLGNLIGGFVAIIIGATLMPTVADVVKSAQLGGGNGTGGSNNVSGTAVTIIGLTTLFYALAIASTGIAVAAIGLRQAGILTAV